MSHVHPSVPPSVRRPSVRPSLPLFVTFPVDKRRITIVKLSSGGPGTMTATEGKGGKEGPVAASAAAGWVF